jgi:hypothetical protein
MKSWPRRLFLKSLLIYFVLVVLSFHVEKFVFIKSIPANVTFFTSDILGNFYIVQKKTLTKYNEKGSILKTYDSKNLGDITSIDVTNPLKILVYYKDFNQLVFLDNTLSISGSPILLEELGISQSSYACTSYGDAFWVFDNTLSQLVRFDKNLIKQNQSDNIAQITDFTAPSYMLERNNSLYISNPSNGILVFDKFGTYNKTLPIFGTNFFQIIENKVFYQSVDMIKSIDLKSLEDNSITLPETAVNSFEINNDLLYITNNTGVSIYKIVRNK